VRQGNERLVVFDLARISVTSSASVGDDPDVLALDPTLRRLYVASESGAVAVFDVASSVRKLGQGQAGPDANSVAVDPGTHTVYLPFTDVGGPGPRSVNGRSVHARRRAGRRSLASRRRPLPTFRAFDHHRRCRGAAAACRGRSRRSIWA